MTRLSELVVFHDARLGRRYAASPMPMASLVEAYLEGGVDIPDVDALLDARQKVVTFTLTADHLKFFVTRMIPEWLVHSRAQDRRIVRAHYDRGDDFFAAFLGETMIYTSGYFGDPGASLEEAQESKMDQVCRKLGLRAGDEMLDVGCGWGALVVHAAKRFGANATGVTLAERGAAYGNARIDQEGLVGRARVLCLDYRDMPKRRYDRIVSLEMVEHVGIRNLARYFAAIRERLHDHGVFLVQWCGLRPGGEDGVRPVGMRPEDMVWGLFMNKYIFSGADASLPLGAMTTAMEKAGFEVESAENISGHYTRTLQAWHRNWQRNRGAVVARYGERLFRLYNVFLAWSWRIGQQGSSACYQVVAHKNVDTCDRRGHAHSAAWAPQARCADGEMAVG